MKPKIIISFLLFLTFQSFSLQGQDVSSKRPKYEYLKDILENIHENESKYPIEGDLALELAYVYMKLNKIDEAIKVLKKEIRNYPADYNARLFLGIAYFMNENVTLALKEFKNIEKKLESSRGLRNLSRKQEEFSISRDPTFLDNRVRLPFIGFFQENVGLLYFSHGFVLSSIYDFEGATKILQNALKAGYDERKTRWHIIQNYIKQRNIQKAKEELEILQANKGNDKKAFFLKGYFFHLDDERDKAITSFKEALAINPYFGEARKNLARMEYNHGNYDEARKHWRIVLANNPNDLEAKINLGRSSFHTGDTEIAEQYFKEAGLAISPEKFSPKYIPLLHQVAEDKGFDFYYRLSILNIGSILNQRALSLIRQGRLDKAEEILLTASVLNREYAPALYNLGMLYFNSGKTEEAKKYCLLSLEHQENFIEAYNLLGRIYYIEEDFKEAHQAFQNAVEIEEWDAVAHYNLGSSYFALEDWKNAEKEWQKAIDLEGKRIKHKEEDIISEDELKISLVVRKKPVSYRAHKSLGWMYLKENLREKALKEFLNAVELEPGDAEAYYEIGKIFKEENKKDEAVFYLEKYLYLGGEAEEEVKEWLKALKK
ncbi:MAG: tetratricopeptide repeat protein [Candidatus Aminicenantaceae bacterium]